MNWSKYLTPKIPQFKISVTPSFYKYYIMASQNASLEMWKGDCKNLYNWYLARHFCACQDRITLYGKSFTVSGYRIWSLFLFLYRFKVYCNRVWFVGHRSQIYDTKLNSYFYVVYFSFEPCFKKNGVHTVNSEYFVISLVNILL